MRKFLLYFSILLFISAASFILFFRPAPVKFNVVTVPGQFSISVPEYLLKTDSIDRDALLQYKNEKEQLFLIVYGISEGTDTLKPTLEKFFEKFSNDLISKIGDANLLKYYPREINSHHALVGNIRGTVNETGVYYRVMALETDHKRYKVIMGVTSNNLSGFDEDMEQIINSFIAVD